MTVQLKWLCAALAFLIAGCAQHPTRVSSQWDIRTADLMERARSPIRITQQTVVLDARPPFEYNLVHVPESYNLQWQDFADTWGPAPGALKRDVAAGAKRLSLFGIRPETPVIVVGSGSKGHGEEGRLAWTLYYLGVNDVQFVSIEHFRKALTAEDPGPALNAPIWKPLVRSSIVVNRDEFWSAIFPKGSPRPANVKVIDVRTEKEFFAKGNGPDLTAVHIDWREFLTPDGRVKLSMAGRLHKIGIQPNDHLYVISNHGVRSAMVTLALLAMGFSHTANYAGGYEELYK